LAHILRITVASVRFPHCCGANESCRTAVLQVLTIALLSFLARSLQPARFTGKITSRK
jgi:hypothetical protein